jgi:hypothetical protein
MKFIQRALIASLLPASLAVAGCDSQGTKEVKQTAKAIDQSYEAQADVVEAAGKNAPDSNATEAKADALRNEGEAIKDKLIKDQKQVQKDTKSN